MNFTPHQLPRRGVLALALSTVGSLSLAACSDDPKPSDGDGTLPANPVARLRAQAAKLEPSYRTVYRVDPSGKAGASAGSGASATYRTIAEACAAVSKDQQKLLAVESQVEAQSNPWAWRKIEVVAGQYDELVVLPPHTALVGLGQKPDDVRIFSAKPDNVLSSTGRSMYVRNLMLEHTSDDQESHPHRDAGGSGDIGLGEQQRRTIIFEQVHFKSAKSAGPGKCTNDMAPSPGTTIVFNRCTFDGPGQPQSVNMVTNRGKAGERSDFFFIGSHVISNFEQHPVASRGQLGVQAAAPIGVPDFGAKRGDRFVWMDGRFTVGTVGGVQAMIVMPYVGGRAHTSNDQPKQTTQFFIANPGSSKSGKTLLFEGGARQAKSFSSDLALPEAGTSTLEWEFFGQQPSAQPATVYAHTATGQKMQLKAGECYWVKVPLGQRAVSVTSVALDGANAQTMSAGCALEEHGKPTTNANGLVSTPMSGPSGHKSSQLPVPRRWFYPGQGAVWVAVCASVDTEVDAFPAAANQAHRGRASQPQPSGMSPVAAGTLVPRVGVVSQLPAEFGK